MFDSSPVNTLRIANLAQEWARLRERLAVIDKELMSDLPALLTAIAAENQKPLMLIDFVVRVIRDGYTTKGNARISPLTFHGLKMLVEQGVLKRDRESKGYVFAGPATP